MIVDFNGPWLRAAAAGSLCLPLVTAALWERKFPAAASAAVRFIAFSILYAVALIVPVQLLAALELLGWINPLRPSLWLIAQALLFAGTLVVARTGGARYPSIRILGEYRDLAPAAGVLAACYALLFANLFTSYPAGYDGMVYHLPLAVRWLQEGSLAMTPGYPWQFSQPGNGNVPMMLLLATGVEPLATGFNAITVVVLAVSVYVLALRCGAGRAGALFAGLIVLSIPMVMFQAVDAFVDLPAAAFFTAGLALFLHPHCDIRRRLLYAALAAGLAAGAKPVFWVWSGMLVFTMLASCWLRKLPIRPMHAALIIVAGAALPSVFWFARAAAFTGNPFYPLPGVTASGGVPVQKDVQGAGTPFGAAPLRLARHRDETVASWLLYPWVESKRSGYNYGPDTGLGAAFATFVPAALLLRFWRLITGRESRAGIAGLLSILLIVSAVLWWFPMARILRFTLPMLAVAAALGAPLLDEIRRSQRRALSVLALVSFLTTAILASIEPLHSLGGRIRTGEWSRALFYGLPELVDRLPAGTRILGTPEVMNFGMAGPRLDLKFLASFEAPQPWTPELIRKLGVDYVIEQQASAEAEVFLRQLNAVLIFDRATTSPVSPRVAVARIWRTAQNTPPP